VQIALELQVVGRISKDQVNRFLWKAVHHLDAVPIQNRIERERLRTLGFGHRLHFLPLSRRLVRSGR
jgi:hypothetical protein